MSDYVTCSPYLQISMATSVDVMPFSVNRVPTYCLDGVVLSMQ